MNANDKTICHDDGTISFWSTLEQSRKDHVAQMSITDLLSFDDRTQDRVRRHLDSHGWVNVMGRFSLGAW